MTRWLLNLPVIFMLAAVPAQATDYYVDDGGSDSNSGAIGSPWQHVKKGVEALGPGDVLYIRAGTYNHADDRIWGVDFDDCAGTNYGAGAVIISAYPAETATLNSSSDNIIHFQQPQSSCSYVIITGTDATTPNLIIDGANNNSEAPVSLGGPNNHHLRFQNVQVKNGWPPCIRGDSDDTDFFDVWANGCGRQTAALYPPGHNGLYFNGDRVHIRGGRYFDNLSYGIRVWHSSHPTITADDGLIEGVRAYGNGFGIGLGGASDSSGGGITMGDYRTILRNSLIYDNEVAVSNLFGRCQQCVLFNNTFSGNGDGINLGALEVDTLIKNNILDHTVTIDGGATGTVEANNFTGDPSYVNAGTFDFHIQTGSGAKTGGVDLSASGVTVDFDGVARPQGASFSRGAYEFDSDTDCDDGVDNDSDTLIDLLDPGCVDAADDDETDSPTPSSTSRLRILRFASLESGGLMLGVALVWRSRRTYARAVRRH